MELISSNQLRNYETILNEVNSGFEKYEKIKKEIDRLDAKIMSLKLCANPCDEKLSHVNIKIFSEISEIHSLYDSHVRRCDFRALSKQDSCNFYLIEVVLTNCILTKLAHLNWKLQIIVRWSGGCICKTITFADRKPIFEIIPVDSNVKECSMETCLFICSDNMWNILDLCKVDLDISYYFESFRRNTIRGNLPETLLNITKLYNLDCNLPVMQPPIQLQTRVLCDNKSHLVASLIQHSYHRLDLEVLSEFSNDDRNIVDAQFVIEDKEVLLVYNKTSNVLKIKCYCDDMLLFKKFFLKLSTFNHSEVILKIKNLLKKKKSLDEMDLEEIVSFYHTLRKVWSS